MKKIVILGAGPAGLGAAFRLKELSYNNFRIFEKNSHVGGLSASFCDQNGFFWDQGGHVIHSHYKYFDEIFEKLMQKEYLEHQREAWIFLMNRYVPYPFQNNIRYLPPKKIDECLEGLKKTQDINPNKAKNFKEWILSIFGDGISKYFMTPYNKKVWTYPLEKMDKNWIAERVSVVDFEKVLHDVKSKRDDVSWGPNAIFKFPKKGGTGDFFRRFTPFFQNNLKIKKEAKKIDIDKRIIYFQDKTKEDFDILINTIPLDLFVSLSDLNKLKKESKKLAKNSVAVIGIGILGKPPKSLQTKCWIYFPEEDYRFYRITVFSNYSPNNAPRGHWSLMAEVSSKSPNIDLKALTEKVILDLIKTGLITEKDKIISRFSYFCPYAYPIPTLQKDEALQKIQSFLIKKNIYSRGRFGAWKYEIGNMDHSLMQGKEVIDLILNKQKESVWSL